MYDTLFLLWLMAHLTLIHAHHAERYVRILTCFLCSINIFVLEISKILSYGASITYGGGAGGPDHAWSANVARLLDKNYQCLAAPGASNTTITRTMISSELSPNCLILAMWTSPTRYEFWEENKWHHIGPADAQTGFVKDWYRGPGQWAVTEIVTTLKEIFIAQAYLQSNNIVYLFTVDNNEIYHDYSSKHSMTYVQKLRSMIDWSKFVFFDGQGFIPWARGNGFSVSDSGHPDRVAHQRASEYLMSHSFFNQLPRGAV